MIKISFMVIYLNDPPEQGGVQKYTGFVLALVLVVLFVYFYLKVIVERAEKSDIPNIDTKK